MVQYDQPFRERLATELEAMPEDAATVVFVGDALAFRAACRALEAVR